MPRRDTAYLMRNPINFTNEEVAILRAFEQLPNTATKAEISARAQQILDETKEIAQKKFAYPPPTRIFHRKRGCP
jgi:hypothetical protein